MNSYSDVHHSILQRRRSMSTTFQMALDVVAVLGIGYSLVQMRVGELTPKYAVLMFLVSAIQLIVYDQHGIYRKHTNTTRKAWSLIQAWTIVFAVLAVLGFITESSEAYSRHLLGEFYVFGLAAQLLLLLFYRFARPRLHLAAGSTPSNALIVGSGPLVKHVYEKISTNPWLGLNVLGCVPEANNDVRGQDSASVPAVGTLDELIELIDRHDIATVYFVTPLDNVAALGKHYHTLLDHHVAIHWIPDIFALPLINHSFKEIAGVPVLTLSETPLVGRRLIVKAIEDYVLGVAILVVCLPLFFFITISIKLDSPGPIFFRQERLGWNGKPFRIWKFRSMVVNAPAEGKIQQASRNDARVTRVGRWLRRTSIDELPQLFNVLSGEMSLVGPRPHAVEHDEEYSRKISTYFARHNIKPGMSGLAQVRGFRGETDHIEKMIQRVESDIEYINDWSLWLDLTILLRTTTALIGKNAY